MGLVVIDPDFGCFGKFHGLPPWVNGFSIRPAPKISLIWLNICQQKNLSIAKKNGLMIFIERLDRGGVCNNDGRAL